MAAKIIIHEMLAGILFYTCFCRSVRMSRENSCVAVRLAFYGLSLASVLMLAAPIVSPWAPSIPTIVLMLAIIIVQVVTSYYWWHGVPKQFKANNENC